MSHRLAVVLALAMVVTACGGDDGPVAGDALADLVQDALGGDDGPGCVVGVTVDGEEEVVAVGMAHLDDGTPLDEDTITDIGSVSKQMTAGVLALLVVGKLGLLVR